MHQLSVLVTTFNEEDNLPDLLESVQWADEIMVVDAFSEDRTLAIAKNYTNFVVQRAYKGPADQKNWAIPQVQNDWLLILDADERITSALKKEIQICLQQDVIPYDAFWIGRQNYFMGQKINYCGWQDDKVVRLMRKDRCRYDSKQVHEEIDTNGLRIGHLKNKMTHYTYKSTHHYLEKLQRYSVWSAQDYEHKTSHITAYHLLLKPMFRFFKHYIIQRGFLDGKVGLILCLLLAWSVFLRYLNMLEGRREKESGDSRPKT